jgi:hypothetical protein
MLPDFTRTSDSLSSATIAMTSKTLFGGWVVGTAGQSCASACVGKQPCNQAGTRQVRTSAQFSTVSKPLAQKPFAMLRLQVSRHLGTHQRITHIASHVFKTVRSAHALLFHPTWRLSSDFAAASAELRIRSLRAGPSGLQASMTPWRPPMSPPSCSGCLYPQHVLLPSLSMRTSYSQGVCCSVSPYDNSLSCLLLVGR